jgi:3-phosphoglycerate kinase
MIEVTAALASLPFPHGMPPAGASLEFVRGKTLPGLAVLEKP